MDLKKFFTFTSVRKVSSCWNKVKIIRKYFLKMINSLLLFLIVPTKLFETSYISKAVHNNTCQGPCFGCDILVKFNLACK